jgi:predicted Zn-dependent peptidase
MRSESTSARMAANLRSWWFEETLYSLDDTARRIDRVSVEEIQNLVQSLDITGKLAAVALGPRAEEDLFGGVLAMS